MKTTLPVLLTIMGLSGCCCIHLRHGETLRIERTESKTAPILAPQAKAQPTVPVHAEPIYLPGASATSPSRSYLDGWPVQLRDKDGANYSLVRDGSPQTDNGGLVALYKKEGEEGLYIPRIESRTLDDVQMAKDP